MALLTRTLLIFGLLVAVFVGARLELFRTFDANLGDFRFASTSRAPSGNIVFVDIDGRSLQSVGVWPWPRSVHARILDKLMAANAQEVVFDIDFSAASTPDSDAAFATALDNAGGYAMLAAFQQRGGSDGQVVLNLPLPQFTRFADPVLVNVQADGSGPVRWVPTALQTTQGSLPSLALALNPKVDAPPAIGIDYGIDLTGIDRISVADLLADHVAPQRLAGKQVIVGASAIELRDFFSVPRFGTIAGPLVQIAAAETLRINRSLTDWGLVPAGIIAALLGLLMLWRGPRLSLATQIVVAVAVAAGTELGAWLLLRFGAIAAQTAPVHGTLFVLLVVALLEERAVRRQQHDRERRQRETMQRVLGQVVTDNFDGIVVLDENNITLAASQAAAAILGQKGSLAGRDMRTYLPLPVIHWLNSGDLRGPWECVCDIDWQSRTLELVATRSEVPDAATARGVRQVTCLTFKDITDRLRQQQRLAYLARHDPVTGALTRLAITDEIDSRLAAETGMRVVVVRLNRLRTVTTALGHQVSDAVLRHVYKRLRSHASVPVARLGTDMFALLFPLQDEAEYRGLIDDLATALETPYELDGHVIILETVFGSSSSLTARTSSIDVLRQAEIALSVHDERGRRKDTAFTPDLAERIATRQTLDSVLRQALEKGEFYLLYQPQSDLQTNTMMGVEALVRWKNASLGTVSPADFIPFAEETGLIVALGDWVMEEACRQAARWDWDGRLSVNVSAVQFRLGDVVRTVRNATERSGFSAARLDIEITESLFAANDPGIITALEELRAMGVGIAIDDFGTGYSSLSYLARLPVDKIKIDQSFVRDLPSAESQAIIETIVAMAGRLHKTVIAEGVETIEQLQYLSAINCHVGQGYYFSRPATPEAIGLRERAPVAVLPEPELA